MALRFPRFQRFVLRGPLIWRLRSLARFISAAIVAAARRLTRGPLLPSWCFEHEFTTYFFRAQCDAAYGLASAGGIEECRQAIDSLVFRMPPLRQVRIAPERAGPLPGQWFAAARPGPVALYFHGGGYALYPAMTDNLIAALTSAVGGRCFVPNYRLAPEHPFPAQLEDALQCYRWMLQQGVLPSRMFVAGNSAGGHLALSLLLSLGDARLPMPAAAVAMSPWIDPGNSGESMRTNEAFDWMTKDMADLLGLWAGAASGRDHPLFRLMSADLTALPPTLIQFGQAELFRDMIDEFQRRHAGASQITFEAWPDMNHNFQGFGHLVGQSEDALARIASFVAGRCAVPG